MYVCICKHPWLAGNPAFFGTSWEQRWWPRHYRNTARLSRCLFSCTELPTLRGTARGGRRSYSKWLYSQLVQQVQVGIVELVMTRDAARPRTSKASLSLARIRRRRRRRAPCFLNVCFTFALLSLPTPRRRRITARLLNPLVTALSLRRCPPAAPQRSATQHKGPVSSGR